MKIGNSTSPTPTFSQNSTPNLVSTPEKPTKSHVKGLTSETSVKMHVKQANLN